FSAGYSYGNDSSQYNYGVTGGVVIHPHGVTLSLDLPLYFQTPVIT
ncbi:fimbria/pilus outer membrane usher protein, partial [Escherichia coli]|nr:fimbria/pilus outer membrane usher protein [Escherichia coli]